MCPDDFTYLAALLLDAGWIDRATAVSTALRSIDKAGSPGIRKDETLVLFEEIKVTTTELLCHTDLLCGFISTGEAVMVEQFALRLIPCVEDAQLSDVALPALYAKTKKATLAVLKALHDRPQPHPETQEVLLPRLDELAHGRDTTTAKQATALIHHWGLDATEREDASLITYAWEDAPRLWELPRFERGVASVEKLAEVAQKLVAQKRDKYLDVSDIHIERFLALANELARTDVKAAQRALKGATQIAGGLFAEWAVRPQRKRYTIITYSKEIFPARLRQLLPRLGQLPCLLSEPSFVDLSITADGLVERLTWYHKAGASVLEADLQLALARLHPTSITASTAGQLAALDVSVVLEDGTVFGRSATQIAREYLTDPVREPGHKLVAGEMVIKAFALPESLAGLPMRLQLNNWDKTDYYCVFPHFGNAAFLNLRWSPKKDPEDAAGIMQVARHGKPLPPAAVVNLFAVQRPTKNASAEFSVALSNAWQRGLIRPGVADIAFLDWRSKLGNLKSLALVLDDAAHAGMLSVVWPILDDLIGACIQDTSLVAGTAEVAVVMETLAPSVAAAIRDGRAPAAAGLVPHVRQLAKRKGRNKAVKAAQNVVAIVADTSPDLADQSWVSDQMRSILAWGRPLRCFGSLGGIDLRFR